METLLLQKMFGRIIKGCTRAQSRYIMNEKGGGEDKGRGRGVEKYLEQLSIAHNIPIIVQ